MDSKERKHLRKKGRLYAILEAAEGIILNEGFSGFTLSNLSKRAGVSRGIIYYYFLNEENVIAKLISDKMVILLKRLNGLKKQKNGYEDLGSILAEFHRFLKDEPGYLTLISYFTTCKLASIKKENMPYYADYENNRDEIFKLCLAAIERGAQDGSVYSKVDPYIMTYAIWAGVGSFWEFMLKDEVLRPVKQPYLKKVDKFLKEYFDMIFRALKC